MSIIKWDINTSFCYLLSYLFTIFSTFLEYFLAMKFDLHCVSGFWVLFVPFPFILCVIGLNVLYKYFHSMFRKTKKNSGWRRIQLSEWTPMFRIYFPYRLWSVKWSYLCESYLKWIMWLKNSLNSKQIWYF